MARSSGSSAWAALSAELAATIERVGKAVVAIHARERIPASGIHWRPGVIVSASHTIKREQDITATLGDGRTSGVTLVGRDPSTDIAVLRLQDGAGSGAASRPATAPIGDPAALRVGELVLALGRPGRDVTATLGLVRALGGEWRTWRGGKIDQMIRLDLGIHDGFSGGALLHAGGDVVALTTSGLGRGAAIAIPATTVDRVVDLLLEHGRVPRGYLGIAVQPVRLPAPASAAAGSQAGAERGSRGAITLAVEPGSPAERAGILIGDVLVALDGEPIKHAGDLMAALGTDRVGQSISIQLVRGGQPREVRVTVGERGGEGTQR